MTTTHNHHAIAITRSILFEEWSATIACPGGKMALLPGYRSEAEALAGAKMYVERETALLAAKPPVAADEAGNVWLA